MRMGEWEKEPESVVGGERAMEGEEDREEGKGEERKENQERRIENRYQNKQTYITGNKPQVRISTP